MDAEQNLAESVYCPTTAWIKASPENLGLAAEKLSNALQCLYHDFPSLSAFVMVKNGYVILEDFKTRPYEPGSSKLIRKISSTILSILNKPKDTFTEQYNDCHNLRSVTKSIVSVLLGIARDHRLIDRIEDSIYKYLPTNYSSTDVQKKNITLRHLLTMTSGIASIESGMNAVSMLLSNGDWVKYILSLPLISEPGERFLYNSANAHLLSAIISHTAEMSTQDYAKKFLFEPLGITDYYWEKDLKGYNFGGGNLFLSAHDMAKIGYLYLNNGFWDGNAIVSKQWVEESLQSNYDCGYGYQYGYMWYVKIETNKLSRKEFVLYSAAGTGGQRIIFAPEFGVIIATTSRTSFTGDKSYILDREIRELILQTCQ